MTRTCILLLSLTAISCTPDESAVDDVPSTNAAIADKASTPTRPSLTCAGDTLGPGKRLPLGKGLCSANQGYSFGLHDDATLALSAGSVKLWQRAIAGARMAMQRDGNLVVSDVNNRAVWSSRTAGKPGATLTLQNDGVVAIRHQGVVVWSLAAPGACTENADCDDGTCVKGRCAAISRSGGACDDIEDCMVALDCGGTGTEQCIDGACRCPDQSTCGGNSECTGTCLAGTCAPRSHQCDENDQEDCVDGTTCVGTRCVLPRGESCDVNGQCDAACREAKCTSLGQRGDACDENADCAEGLACSEERTVYNPSYHKEGHCLSVLSAPCMRDSDCASLSCECQDARCSAAYCTSGDICTPCQYRLTPDVVWGPNSPSKNCGNVAAGHNDLVDACAAGTCNGNGACARAPEAN